MMVMAKLKLMRAAKRCYCIMVCFTSSILYLYEFILKSSSIVLMIENSSIVYIQGVRQKNQLHQTPEGEYQSKFTEELKNLIQNSFR